MNIPSHQWDDKKTINENYIVSCHNCNRNFLFEMLNFASVQKCISNVFQMSYKNVFHFFENMKHRYQTKASLVCLSNYPKPLFFCPKQLQRKRKKNLKTNPSFKLDPSTFSLSSSPPTTGAKARRAYTQRYTGKKHKNLRSQKKTAQAHAHTLNKQVRTRFFVRANTCLKRS